MTTAKHFPLHFGYIWWDCLPSNRKYQAEQHIKKTIVVQSSNVLDARQIGLKLDLHKHHHISGILGIEFTPDDSKELTIEIAVKDTRLGDGPVSSGLPKQFAEVVLDEMTKALQEVSFISGGQIKVNHAAWDIVNSPPYIFRLLARSLVYLLSVNEVDENVLEDKIRLAMKHIANK